MSRVSNPSGEIINTPQAVINRPFACVDFMGRILGFFHHLRLYFFVQLSGNKQTAIKITWAKGSHKKEA
jgi:hypothetical protein